MRRAWRGEIRGREIRGQHTYFSCMKNRYTVPEFPAFHAAILALLLALAPARAGEANPPALRPPSAEAGQAADIPAAPVLQPGVPLTFQEADRRLDIADRMVQAGVYDSALELADSVLDHPDAQATGSDQALNGQWLVRREKARFLSERCRLGLAAASDEMEDAAQAFMQLSENRYRLAEPAYAVQSAYWAARAYEMIGEYRSAADQYARVGGVTLPQEMEGDAAQRMSRCLRFLAEAIPYPGGIRDRQRREVLLNQAITELDRARFSFPVGNRRKEIELDLIALRMARREEQFVREAATEAETFIKSDPAKDELRARATFYRGQAAAMLGNPSEAAEWFEKVLSEEAPSPDDRRSARMGLALALLEMAESAGGDEKRRLLRQADEALGPALAEAASPGPWDGARVIEARVQLDLDQPSAALDTLRPILEGGRVNPPAWRVAGIAELRRGSLGDAIQYLYPATRPSAGSGAIRYDSIREASLAAAARRDYGLALALNHQASEMLRRDRLFTSLLAQEFAAMETILKLGRMGGPVSLSGDADLLASDSEAAAASPGDRRREALEELGKALGGILWRGGNPDSGYDLSVMAESADEWIGDSIPKIELAIAMISHLRMRQPAMVTDSILSSRLGEAKHALAIARADRAIRTSEPDEAEVDHTLRDFAEAARSFQEASVGGLSVQDSLDQGMVNMESGAFLMGLSEKWESGRWAARAASWREEARLRIEASLKPFNQAIATSTPASLAARRARWSRGRALELMGEWRGAAADYLSLMNNSELSRVLRANAARRWAVCMGRLGESRAALTRLKTFAEIDAEAALLAGHLAEEAGYPREAFGQYLFAADPDSPALPPATPGRVQEASYQAARLALANPNEANPFLAPEVVVADARRLLETNALADDSGGEWPIRMMNLLGESWLKEPDGWRTAYVLAQSALERPGAGSAMVRAMHLLSARAQAMGGNYPLALNELDAAREFLDDASSSRADAADITLETARVYREQGRFDDALRAYAEVFAIYPDQQEADDAAREESATMLLSSPAAGQREREQARGILSGLRDQTQAERIMREYGIR